eukprot:TRINITY_DN27084_c0_g1_i1.p1 TRINITY_DN27084_c0_g1~~TRINITY_DN27084_c0_g1_i1.p1  ORF type:complete len:604 (+),score=203.71 TRINITY_DN27084_c0_g1_i1:34-1812(+)
MVLKHSVLLALVGAVSSSFPTDVVYDALHVYPAPVNVTLPTNPLGPHVLSTTSQVNIDSSCGSLIQGLVTETLTLKTRFTPSPRSYQGSAYVQADSYCPDASKCSADSDCGAGKKCLAPDFLRWNSTMKCPPSVKYGHGCGCCTTVPTPTISTINIVCNKQGIAQEGYTLDVTASGVSIGSSTPKGAAYALSTLSQLIRWDTVESQYITDFVPLSISDAPKFPYRGVMIDTSRHFISVDEILNTIDGMYAAKLNIFHWHIIDSPSFPYESVKYPELAREGSWGGNATIYTQADIAKVVARATSRFVEVMFEFDTPAHTMAFGKSHPEVMTDCWEWMATSGYKVDVDSDDCQALNPILPATKTIVTDLITEAAQISNSQYFHVGGDEVKYPCWDSDPTIKAYVAANYGGNYEMLQADWTANVSVLAATKMGKKPVLWQPTTDVSDPVWINALPADTVYMVWLGPDAAVGYAKQGKDVVITSPFYVDGMGTGSWNSVYNTAIIPDGLTDAEAKHIIGAAICAWGEMMTTTKVGMETLTIGAGIAESLWKDHPSSPSSGSAQGLATSQRYNHFLCHVQRYGSQSGQIMPSGCQTF